MILSPEFIDLIRDAMDSRANKINTCLPAKVTSYDHTKQTVCVIPSIMRPMPTDTGGRTDEPIPELLDVPVAFPRAGDFVMHLPLEPGDYVLLLFSQYGINEFLATGEQHDQQRSSDIRQHSLGAAIAIAGVFPNAVRVDGLSATEVLLGKPGGSGVGVSASKVKVGNQGGTMKRAARKGDPVKITLTPAHFATLALSNGAGIVSTLYSVEVFGTITEGSTTVDISD